MLARWREERRLRPLARQRAPRPRSGASTRARRPPTAAPAPTTSSPASSRTSTRATRRCAATGCRARRAGTATACRSSSRSKSSSGSPPSRRSRSSGSPSSTSRCRESVFEYVEEWNRLTERIGFWIDLDDPYVTLEDDYIESVWWSLQQLWDDDRLYEGHKVVPYCPRCGTALSSHEVAQGYKDVEDPSIYVRFPLLGEDGGEAGESLLVWTTTPWTLPGNVAVAVAPEVTYVRARVGDEIADPRRAAGREGARGGGRGRSTASPAPTSSAAPTAAPSSTSPTAARRTPSGSSPATSSPPRTAPAWSTSPPPSARTTTRSPPPTAIFDPTDAGTLYNPVGLDGNFDRPGHRLRGPVRQGPRGDQGADRRPRARAACSSASRSTSTPTRTAGAAARRSSTTRSRAGTSPPRRRATRCSPTTRRSAGTPSTSSTAASANGWRTTSTGRSRATATGGRRCRSGSAPTEGCDGRFCAGSVAELRERAGGEVPDDLHRPYIDEVTVDCEDCGGEMRRVDSVIDTWYDSGAMPFAQFHYPFEDDRGVRGALPGRLHLRGPGPDPRLVLHPARRVDPAVRHLQLPQLRLPRPDPRPRGPEDVEEPRQRRRPLGRDRPPTAPTPSAGTT